MKSDIIKLSMLSLRIKSSLELYELLIKRLREDQFDISFSKNTFNVKVKYIPPNFSIPERISYFKVNLVKV